MLVDLHGEINALPKLIDDRNVRTKDIREFLGAEFAPENLPSVEDARAQAAKHRKALEDHKAHEQKADAIADLKKAQAQRRQKVEQQQADLRARQDKERQHLERRQRHMRDVMRGAYIPGVRELKRRRRENRPTGLAAFLGRITGVDAARRALHRYQDRKRIRSLIAEREKLWQQQARNREDLQRKHEMQAAELARQERALNQIDRKELHSLEESLRAEQRTAARGGHGKMPSLARDSKSRGRPAAPGKAKSRYRSRFAEELAKSAGKGAPEAEKKIDLEAEFERAAADGKDGKSGRGSSDGPKPLKRSRSNRRRRRDQDKDRGR